MTRSYLVAIATLLWLQPQQTHARATFKLSEQGPGFADTTRVQPIGGNPGTTLGEQRHLALQRALELWSAYLDSAVPIELDVDFSEQGCGGRGTILGAARAVELLATPQDASVFYPSALANSLAGEDLTPEHSDIHMTLNASVDHDCLSATNGFYYGFDGHAGDTNDFVEVVLHELAHGLGFSSFVDPTTGMLTDAGMDPFSARLFDLDQQRSWVDLTSAQRARSASNVRHLAWSGPEAARVAALQLQHGQPQLSFDPAVPQFSSFVSDTSIGQTLAATPVSGSLVLGQNCGVAAPSGEAGAWIALFPQCHALEQAARAAREAGAVAALLVGDSEYDAPPLPLEAAADVAPIAMPLLMLSKADARVIQLALSSHSVQAKLASDETRPLGTDAQGRPLMFSSQPINPGSSVSHVDPSLRPNQLMEPFATPEPAHDLTLTRAFLVDIGWQSRCGDGHLDPGEECDEGEHFDDHSPNGCRSNCRKGYCGDGVRDAGEACDEGLGNSDARPNGCRHDCQHAHCGDGVLDDKEQCDDGTHNDNHARGACRTSCRAAYCGDGVVDAIEQCDDGDRNDDQRADACRRDCRAPRCGDGVVDKGEACDHGRDNGTSAADGCRTNCTHASCGDGVVDPGEECDGSDQCTTECRRMQVHDAGTQWPPIEPDASTDEGGKDDAGVNAVPHKSNSGCGCRIARESGQTGHARAGWLLALLGCVICRRIRLRRAQA